MMPATSKPKGFSSIDSLILPSVSNKTARVVPQDGQGYPVTFLMIHTRTVSFCTA